MINDPRIEELLQVLEDIFIEHDSHEALVLVLKLRLDLQNIMNIKNSRFNVNYSTEQKLNYFAELKNLFKNKIKDEENASFYSYDSRFTIRSALDKVHITFCFYDSLASNGGCFGNEYFASYSVLSFPSEKLAIARIKSRNYLTNLCEKFIIEDNFIKPKII